MGITKHGLARRNKRHLLYNVWGSMIQRCTNPNDKGWENYGGRGITICEEWQDSATFMSWALNHGWRKGLTLERVDNNKGYHPDNCAFTGIKEQNRNNRRVKMSPYDVRVVRQLIADGNTVTSISRAFRVQYHVIYQIKRGISWTDI